MGLIKQTKPLISQKAPPQQKIHETRTEQRWQEASTIRGTGGSRRSEETLIKMRSNAQAQFGPGMNIHLECSAVSRGVISPSMH